LIDNSIKYTPKGSIDIKLSEDAGKILLEVSDTGIGIPKDGMDKLFKKFSRLENASEENVQGTGLGLYLAKK
jgi:signal transduction histidine kinase